MAVDTEGEPVTTEHLTEYPSAHHVVVPYRTIYPNGKFSVEDPVIDDVRTMQQVRTIVIDDKPLCLPLDGVLEIAPLVGAGGHRITVEFFADSVLFEPNPDL